MRLGHKFTKAKDGNEAIEKFKENIFNYIIMDYQMPSMNGDVSISKIREMEKDIRSFIYVSSSHPENFLVEAFKNIDIDGFFKKPPSLKQFEVICQSHPSYFCNFRREKREILEAEPIETSIGFMKIINKSTSGLGGITQKPIEVESLSNIYGQNYIFKWCKEFIDGHFTFGALKCK